MVNYEKYKKTIADRSVKDVFRYIYKNNIWEDSETVSGSGSNTVQTKKLVQLLPILFRKYHIKSILDLPCGDFNWFRSIRMGCISYAGGDIVEEIIDKNRLKYSKKTITFECLDLTSSKLPSVDLLLCRDCFVHFSNHEIAKSLKNIKRYRIKYLLTTTFPKTRKNIDIITGEWRSINMAIKPFNLRAIEILNEGCTEDNGKYTDKSLMLIDLRAVDQ